MDQSQGELSHLPRIVKLMIFKHLVALSETHSKIIAPIDQPIQMVLHCPDCGKGKRRLEAVQWYPFVKPSDSSLFLKNVCYQLSVIA